jgi:hypothetical protein
VVGLAYELELTQESLTDAGNLDHTLSRVVAYP